MPKKNLTGEKHLITYDFILQIYKESKTMETSEQKKVVEKLKDIVKYVGKEITINF